MNYNFIEEYDIIVIGAGHAGVEASLAASRMGCKVLLATINIEMLAFMPCNPSIGGSAKGIVVREVDALGGEMAKNIDKTYIQMKMLNLVKVLRFVHFGLKQTKNFTQKKCGKRLKTKKI